MRAGPIRYRPTTKDQGPRTNSHHLPRIRRPAPRRASEAMVAGRDPPAQKSRWVKIPDIPRRIRVYGNIQRSVEIAIIQRAVPAHVNLIAAHQAVERIGHETVRELLRGP